MREANAVDWGGLAGIAARLLGWTPDIFWAATPAELVGAMRATLQRDATRTLSRNELTELAGRFPDR